jgi:hypothetical protein
MLVLMSLPPNGVPGLTFLGTIAVLVVAWFAGVRKVFKGPAVALRERPAVRAPSAEARA